MEATEAVCSPSLAETAGREYYTRRSVWREAETGELRPRTGHDVRDGDGREAQRVRREQVSRQAESPRGGFESQPGDDVAAIPTDSEDKSQNQGGAALSGLGRRDDREMVGRSPPALASEPVVEPQSPARDGAPAGAENEVVKKGRWTNAETQTLVEWKTRECSWKVISDRI